MPDNEFKSLRIEEIKEPIAGVKLFYFDTESSQSISYKAGQYLTFVWRQEHAEVRRSYSIVSTPGVDARLAIGIKRVDNGLISRKLFDTFKTGDRLFTLGAGGVFILPLPETRATQFFFFAAGSGIIPVYSLIKAVLYQHTFLQAILIYSNHTRASTLFYKELTSLAGSFPERLKIEFLFSDNQNLFKAHLHAELIQSLLKTYVTSNVVDPLYYLCGPETYMRLCVFTLREAGVPAAQIKKEIFYTTPAFFRNDPPDKEPHTVTIIRNNREYKIQVQYPTTILQAAKNRGILLPYSCEAGRCGNCMAVCNKGEVWMAYNEVLTEKELKQGFILTCTGYPVKEDAIIEIRD